MNLIDQARVGSAFDRAEHYAHNAGVQRQIAADLADIIEQIHLSENPRLLEIGCGTGFLTRELLARGIEGEWLVTDKAPAMVARCREEVAEAPHRSFALLDGEYGLDGLVGQFDLICASMAMQWFDDLETAVARLVARLAPGGHPVFNTLAEATFAEWRAAHRQCGEEAGAIAFPPAGELQAMLGQFNPISLSVTRRVEQHDNARQFLERLKLIGAGTARRDHHPLPPGALKQVMAAFDSCGARSSYEVVACHIARGSEA